MQCNVAFLKQMLTEQTVSFLKSNNQRETWKLFCQDVEILPGWTVSEILLCLILPACTRGTLYLIGYLVLCTSGFKICQCRRIPPPIYIYTHSSVKRDPILSLNGLKASTIWCPEERETADVKMETEIQSNFWLTAFIITSSSAHLYQFCNFILNF